MWRHSTCRSCTILWNVGQGSENNAYSRDPALEISKVILPPTLLSLILLCYSHVYSLCLFLPCWISPCLFFKFRFLRFYNPLFIIVSFRASLCSFSFRVHSDSFLLSLISIYFRLWILRCHALSCYFVTVTWFKIYTTVRSMFAFQCFVIFSV